MKPHGRKISIVIGDGYGEARLNNIHSRLRQWCEAQGVRVVKTSTMAVCATCWGDGYTIPDGQGCVVIRTDSCADCNGTGRPMPRKAPS